MKTLMVLLIAATSFVKVPQAFASYGNAEFEAEEALGDSDAALYEAEERKKLLQESKVKNAEAKAKARVTASEARALEKEASSLTRTVEKEVAEITQQTALFQKQIDGNEAYKRKYSQKIAYEKARLEKAKKNRDRVYQAMKAAKASK
jgi:hypothetical protein